MNRAAFRVAPLDLAHHRSTFRSGSEPLDRYFRQQVTQDIRRRVTACFAALTHEDRVAGYYTLASASILLADLPEQLCKKLPRYPSVPAVRMGRLAVDLDFKGQGLGGALLADALHPCEPLGDCRLRTGGRCETPHRRGLLPASRFYRDSQRAADPVRAIGIGAEIGVTGRKSCARVFWAQG